MSKSSNGGMGMSKHRKSGHSPKSPRYRHKQQLEANKSDIKTKPSTCLYSSVTSLLNDSVK